MKNYVVTIRAFEEPDKYEARQISVTCETMSEAYREAFDIFMFNLREGMVPEQISIYGEEL